MNPFIELGLAPEARFAIAFVGLVVVGLLFWMFNQK